MLVLPCDYSLFQIWAASRTNVYYDVEIPIVNARSLGLSRSQLRGLPLWPRPRPSVLQVTFGQVADSEDAVRAMAERRVREAAARTRTPCGERSGRERTRPLPSPWPDGEASGCGRSRSRVTAQSVIRTTGAFGGPCSANADRPSRATVPDGRVGGQTMLDPIVRLPVSGTILSSLVDHPAPTMAPASHLTTSGRCSIRSS